MTDANLPKSLTDWTKNETGNSSNINQEILEILQDQQKKMERLEFKIHMNRLMFDYFLDVSPMDIYMDDNSGTDNKGPEPQGVFKLG